MRCGWCGTALAGRSDRRYCSSGCKSAAHRERRGGVGLRALVAALLDPPVDEVVAARTEVALVAAIGEAAREDWRAARWLLERRYPERWGSGRSARERYDPFV